MEKILLNIDVLNEILKYLNLEDQLKLCNVCPQFRTVILEFMWKKKYQEVEITETGSTYVISTNIRKGLESYADIIKVLREEKIILNTEYYKQFINLASGTMKSLSVKSSRSATLQNFGFKSSRSATLQNFGLFENCNNFTNLTSITINSLILSDNDLKLLNVKCPQLANLTLYRCINFNFMEIKIGYHLQVCTIQNMKMLTNFKIITGRDKSEHTQDELLNIKMKKIMIDERQLKPTNKYETLSNSCEELTIAPMHTNFTFSEFYNKIFINFSNLQKLNIKGYYCNTTIDEDFFYTIISKTHIKCLNITDVEIHNFIPLYTINELQLVNCDGLTWKDIKTIFCDMKLKSLTIRCIRYIGIFEYFNISTTLENLHVTGLLGHEIIKLLKMNTQNLKNLSTFVCDNNELWPIVKNCIKLKQLTIDPSLLNQTYSSFVELLQHSSLTHLKLNINIPMDTIPPTLQCGVLKTNLLCIRLKHDIFDEMQDFWLNLLKNNRKLKIIIMTCYITKLKGIINHSKFPTHLKSIKIRGFDIELKELKEDFENAINKFKPYLSMALNEVIL